MIGRQDAIGIRPETTWGVENTAGTIFWIPMKDPKFTPKVEYAEDDSGMGRREAPLESDVVGRFGELQLNQVAYDLAIGFFLKAAYGAVNTVQKSAPNTGVYDHALTVPVTNTLPSFTVYYKNATQNLKMRGCVVNVFEMGAELKDYAMANVALMGKFPEDSTETATFANSVFGTRFTTAMAQFKHAADVAALSGAGNATFESMKFIIENNVTAIFETGDTTIANNLEPMEMEAGTQRVRGDATIKFRNTTYYNLFKNATNQALEFALVNQNKTIGDDQNPAVKFTVAKTKVKEWDRDNGLDDVVKQTMGFVGHMDLDAGFMSKCDLTNTQAAY